MNATPLAYGTLARSKGAMAEWSMADVSKAGIERAHEIRKNLGAKPSKAKELVDGRQAQEGWRATVGRVHDWH
jgi:hypothetical protein